MPKILLVEPDPLIARNIIKYLGRAGHKVSFQPDPQSAVNIADKNRPDLVITDLWLSVHNGVEFLYEFRSYPDWLTVPIIIYSNVAPEELGLPLAALEELKISAYHYKPETSLQTLAGSVDRVLQMAL